jgi:hypothetical protein
MRHRRRTAAPESQQANTSSGKRAMTGLLARGAQRAGGVLKSADPGRMLLDSAHHLNSCACRLAAASSPV